MKKNKLTLEMLSGILSDAVLKRADDSPDNMIIRKNEKNYWKDLEYKTDLLAGIYDIVNLLKKQKNIAITSLCFKTSKRPTRTVLNNLKSYGFVYSKNNSKKKKEQEYYFSCELRK